MFEYLKLENILKAFKATPCSAKLLFMGQGTKKSDLVLYSKQLKIQNRVFFHKWVNRELIPEILAKSNIGLIYMSNTLFERCKCPGKVYEYMAMELPIISTDVGEPSVVIKQAKCGILVPPDDPFAMAEAMNYLIDHPALRRAMGKRGRDYLMKKQNYSCLSERVEQFISSAIYGNRHH